MCGIPYVGTQMREYKRGRPGLETLSSAVMFSSPHTARTACSTNPLGFLTQHIHFRTLMK